MAIDAKPKQLFDIGSIQDPVLRNNFEVLNRELLKRQVASQTSPSNIVYSGTLNPTGQLLVGVPLNSNGGYPYFNTSILSVTIETKGNPVELMLIPGNGGVSANFGLFDAVPPGITDFGVVGGYYRTSNGAAGRTTVGSQMFDMQIVASQITHMTIPLPAFVFEDDVPAGVYTYLFWARQRVITNTHLWTSAQNIKLRAKELR